MTSLKLIDLPPELLAYISSFIFSIDRLTCLNRLHSTFHHALKSQLSAALNLQEVPFRFQNWSREDIVNLYQNYYASHLFIQTQQDLDLLYEFEEKLTDSARSIETTVWDDGFAHQLKRILRDFVHVTHWVLDFDDIVSKEIYGFLCSIAARAETLCLTMGGFSESIEFPVFSQLKTLKVNNVKVASLNSFPKLEYFHGAVSQDCEVSEHNLSTLKEVSLQIYSVDSLDSFFNRFKEKLVDLLLVRVNMSAVEAEYVFKLLEEHKVSRLHLVVSNLLTVLTPQRMRSLVQLPRITELHTDDFKFPEMLFRVWASFPNASSIQITFYKLWKVTDWSEIEADRVAMERFDLEYYGGDFADRIQHQFQEIERRFKKYVLHPEKHLSTTKIRRILDKSEIIPVFYGYCYRRFWFRKRSVGM